MKTPERNPQRGHLLMFRMGKPGKREWAGPAVDESVDIHDVIIAVRDAIGRAAIGFAASSGVRHVSTR